MTSSSYNPQQASAFGEEPRLHLATYNDFCLCFERFKEDQLNVAANGQKEDVCKRCAEMEPIRKPNE